jgi:hypothetical protein
MQTLMHGQESDEQALIQHKIREGYNKKVRVMRLKKREKFDIKTISSFLNMYNQQLTRNTSS